MIPDRDRRPPVEYRDRSFSQPEYHVSRFGPLAFANARYGPLLNNNDLVARLPPPDQAQGLEAIEHVGITERHAAYFDGPKNEAALVNQTAKIGAGLIHQIRAASGWPRVDHVNFTSAFLPETINDLTLQYAGLDPRQVTTRSYRLACAGSVAAMIDTLRNSRLQDKYVVTLSLEPLSYLFGPENLTLDHVAIPGIFGDDYAGFGTFPKDIRLHLAHILVEPDGGLIKYRSLYQLPPHDPRLVPDHYTLDRGAERIISFSQRGVMIKIENAGSIKGTTISGRTGGYFASKSVRHIINSFLKPLPSGMHIDSVVFHPASKLVVDKTQQYLEREVPRVNLNLPPIGYYLNEMGRSNSSSADTPTTWQYMAERGLVHENDTILVYAPGIGAAFAGMVIRFR